MILLRLTEFVCSLIRSLFLCKAPSSTFKKSPVPRNLPSLQPH